MDNKVQLQLKIGDFVEGKGIYAGILYDENGENPKELFVATEDAPEEIDWDTTKAQDYGQYRLPDIRELMQIHLYQNAINAGLKRNGGEVLRNEYYWSSTEYSAGYAWTLNFYNGRRGAPGKGYSSYVRPVLAFDFREEQIKK